VKSYCAAADTLLLLAALPAFLGCPPETTSYALTVSVTGEGAVVASPPGGTYAAGTTVTLTALPAEGWEFDGWSGDLTGIARSETIVMNSDKSLQASFVEEDWQPDQFAFDVDVAPGTVMVPEANLGLLLASDPETGHFEFDTAGAQAAGITFAAGAPLVVHGVAIRRITDVSHTDGRVLVETEPIALNEVIPSGSFAWDYGVEFTEEKVRALIVPGYGAVPVKDGAPIEFELEVGEYTYGIKATLDGVYATFEFTVSKDLTGSAGAKFVARGEIRRFRSRENLAFGGGELQEFGHELTGMRGEATLELVVAASGSDAVDFKLPVPVFEVPFAVGFVPVVLKVKAQFVVNASVPVDGSARVRARFTYDSDLGFAYDGADVHTGGSLGGLTLGDELHETGASSAIDANFGVGFPRVELNIAGGTVVPWAQTAFLVGGTYTFHPACQTADALFLGAAGFDLTVLDWNLFSGSRTFFSESIPLLRAGDCPDKGDCADTQDTLSALTARPLE